MLEIQDNIPLSLYIHIPWCVKKCPYCDFNSHENGAPPWRQYVQALLVDLEQSYSHCNDRLVNTIFFGGGTPSLMPGAIMATLLAGIRQRVPLAETAEVTLEANPGASDAENFQYYVDAGVNRLSIGAQSFRDEQLSLLGRIHSAEAIFSTFELAGAAGFKNINLDVMHSLPNDSAAGALKDLQQAIELQPTHLSWYELTFEEGTAFARKPPTRPQHEEIVLAHESGVSLMQQAGYCCYEVSAYARDGLLCRHNLNYWQFGDYLGVGAGAHGKISRDGRIYRSERRPSPLGYMTNLTKTSASTDLRPVPKDEIITEFMLNAFRLKEGFSLDLFEARTGINRKLIERPLATALDRCFINIEDERVVPTSLGSRFLNDLLLLFIS